jgi:HK97 family phage major capsid protein
MGSTVSNKELVQKATIAVSDLTTNGGYLNPEQENQFFRKLIDQPTIVREARTVFMNAPKREINKVGFGTRILKPGVSNVALTESDRSKPTTEKVTLTTKEVIAEVRIPYDVLEDNIERNGFADTIMEMMAERAALDIEELILLGDTTLDAADPYLDLVDGALVRAISNVSDAGSTSINKTVFKNAIKAMPDRYLRNRAAMRFYVSIDNELEWRDSFGNRQTTGGDSAVTTNNAITAFGVPVIPVALMPADKGLFTDPKNMVIGIQRNVLVETDKDITARVWIIVLTMRLDFVYEEEPAVVKIINLA